MLSPQSRAALQEIVAILLALLAALAQHAGQARRPLLTRLALRALEAGLTRFADQLTELAASPGSPPAVEPSVAVVPGPPTLAPIIVAPATLAPATLAPATLAPATLATLPPRARHGRRFARRPIPRLPWLRALAVSRHETPKTLGPDPRFVAP